MWVEFYPRGHILNWITGDKVHWVAHNGVDSLDTNDNAAILKHTVISTCECWQSTWMGNPIGNDSALTTSLQHTLIKGDGPKLLSQDEVASKMTRTPWKDSLRILPQPLKRDMFSIKATKYSLSLHYKLLNPLLANSILMGISVKEWTGWSPLCLGVCACHATQIAERWAESFYFWRCTTLILSWVRREKQLWCSGWVSIGVKLGMTQASIQELFGPCCLPH